MPIKKFKSHPTAILNLEQKISEAFRLFKPPPKLTVSEWADTYRFLPSESVSESGKWFTSRVPFVKEIMDCYTDPRINYVVFQKPNQVAGTETLLNFEGWVIHQAPAPILHVMPTEAIAKDFSKRRFAPTVRDSPVLSEIIDIKAKSADNELLSKQFPGGSIKFVGASSASSFISMPIKYVLFDEVDFYDTISEGDQIELGIKRTNTFSDAKIIIMSTPGMSKEVSTVVKWMSYTDMRKYHVPCPFCGTYQELIFSNLIWRTPDDTIDKFEGMRADFESFPIMKPHYLCCECKKLIPETEKMKMLNNGKWTPTQNGRPGYVGFFINGLYSPFPKASWKHIVDGFTKSKNDKNLLRVFTNTVLAEAFEDWEVKIDENELLNNCEDWEDLPNGILVLTMAVDVQDDRLEYLIKGWGLNEESWTVDYGQLYGNPADLTTEDSLWLQLDKIHKKKFTKENGQVLQVKCLVVDAGGHHSQEVYEYCKARALDRVFAIRGKGGVGHNVLVTASTNNKLRTKVWYIGIHGIKDTIFHRLQGFTGSDMHFKKGLCGLDYFKQLTSEVCKTTYSKGNMPRLEYVKKSSNIRNEVLDMETYNHGALAILNPDLEYLSKMKPAVEEPKPVAKKTPIVKQSYAKRW